MTDHLFFGEGEQLRRFLAERFPEPCRYERGLTATRWTSIGLALN